MASNSAAMIREHPTRFQRVAIIFGIRGWDDDQFGPTAWAMNSSLRIRSRFR